MITKSLDALSKKQSAKLSLEQLADPEYTRMSAIWDLCDDVFAGELAVKARDNRYIYQPVSKSGVPRKRAWEAYKARGVMPDFAAETLEKMCGILASAPPDITFDGSAKRLDFLREDATPFHDGLDALAGRVRRHILRSGRYCLLLEPSEDEEKPFHINEYKCRKFLRAKTVEENGESIIRLVLLDTSRIQYDTRLWRDVYYPQITLLALDEAGNYYQAKFGSIGAAIERYAKGAPVFRDNEQYSAAMGQVFDALEGFDADRPSPEACTELLYPSLHGRMLQRIPFVCINPGDLHCHDYWNPPLLRLCLQAIHILDADCTYKTALFMTGDPQPVVTGAAKTDMKIGSDNIMWLPEGADFRFVSPSGAGLAEQAASLQRMKEDAARMGVSLAGQENLGSTPVGTMQLYRNSQTADLVRINQNTGKAVELILRYAGTWLGMKPEDAARDIAFIPSDSFADIKATPQECVALAESSVPMTTEEKRLYLEKNNIVSPRPWEEVKDELDAEAAERRGGDLDSVAEVFGFPKNGNPPPEPE